MKKTTKAMRRSLYSVFAASAVGGDRRRREGWRGSGPGPGGRDPRKLTRQAPGGR